MYLNFMKKGIYIISLAYFLKKHMNNDFLSFIIYTLYVILNIDDKYLFKIEICLGFYALVRCNAEILPIVKSFL